jgi:hypothetical protein
MRSRTLAGLVAVGAFLGAVLATTAASAQGQPDGVRFRGGVGLDVGAFFVPGSFNEGLIGVTGQLGAQINNNWGVYGVPQLDILFGSATGVSVSFGPMADYTFDNIPISVGAGLEAGVFAAFGGLTAGAGAYYGGRLRAAWYPILVRSEVNPIRRKALYLALDLHLDDNAAGGTASAVGCVNGVGACGATVGGFIIAPVVSVGYSAF